MSRLRCLFALTCLQALKVARDPNQQLFLVGSKLSVHRKNGTVAAHQEDERKTLVPWNGRGDVLIDRFDVRALMDFMPAGSVLKWVVPQPPAMYEHAL